MRNRNAHFIQWNNITILRFITLTPKAEVALDVFDNLTNLLLTISISMSFNYASYC